MDKQGPACPCAQPEYPFTNTPTLMASKQIETVAYIVKEEQIMTIDHNVRPNTFVVEAQEPYPGYHGLYLPNTTRQTPGDVFFILKKRFAAELIAHITRRVKRMGEIDFDAARAELYFFNDTYPAIRVRGLASYDQIEELQKWYLDHDVPFAKKERTDTKAIIKIQKMLSAEEIEPGIFQDLDDPKSRYFALPDELSWQEFAKITLKIKRNHSLGNYDAAWGGIFRRSGLVDVVRIFADSDFDLDHLKQLQSLYLDEYNKLQ